jgi:iron(III) transport system ATP-binding protein
MSSGKLLQWGTAQDLYHRPVCKQVAEFVGKGTFLRCEVVGDAEVRTALGVIKGSPVHPLKPGDRGIVLIRPEDIVHDDNSPFMTDISDRIYLGPNILYTLKLDSGEEVLSLVPSHHDHPEGTGLGIRVELEELVVFGNNSDP